VWSAMAAGALWRVKRGAPFRWVMLREPRLIRVFAAAVLLHMIWDTSFEWLGDLPYLLAGLIAWYMVASLIQEGLQEIRDEQRGY
jgi:hypothetical protein